MHDVQTCVQRTLEDLACSEARGRSIAPWNLRRLFERRWSEAREHDGDPAMFRAGIVTGRRLLERRPAD